jgi:hypothetical protein
MADDKMLLLVYQQQTPQQALPRRQGKGYSLRVSSRVRSVHFHILRSRFNFFFNIFRKIGKFLPALGLRGEEQHTLTDELGKFAKFRKFRKCPYFCKFGNSLCSLSYFEEQL